MKLLEAAGCRRESSTSAGDAGAISDACFCSATSPVCTSPVARLSLPMWKTIAPTCAVSDISTHRRRDGWKDFILAHPSADAEALPCDRACGFEYQGQSVRPRVASTFALVMNEVPDRTVEMIGDHSHGRCARLPQTYGAVIDQKAHAKVSEYLDDARVNAKVLSVA